MTETFIKKGVFTIGINLLILLLGYFTLPYLSNEFIPTINIPAVAIIVPTPLMATQKMEEELAPLIESAFLKTGEIKTVETRIDQDKAIFIVFYKWDYTPEKSLLKARSVVSNLKLPAGTLDPIFILHRPSNNPIFRVTFYGDNLQDVSEYARKIQSLSERIPGVAEVSLRGDAPKKIIAKVSNEKLLERGLNTSDIVYSAKNFWNFKLLARGHDTDHSFKMDSDNFQDLKNFPVVSLRSRKSARLGDVVTMTGSNKEATVKFNGKIPATILEIIKSPGADTIAIIKDASRLIDESPSPEGVKGKVIYDEAKKIKESQDGVFKNFFIGVALNSIILMIFLGSSIGVLVASVVFPTSLLGTLFMMKYFGITINLFSLNGFSLAVGMITDASTVVLESITRRISQGEEIFRACVKGVSDVRLGVLASTLTTAGVLLPIAMQKNLTSKLFSDLALTVVSTQLLCLIAVFSLVPWLCFKMLGGEEKRTKVIDILYKMSNRMVNWLVGLGLRVQSFCRETRKKQGGIPSLITLFSLSMLLLLPKTEFLPLVTSKVYSLSLPIDEGVYNKNVTSYSSDLSDRLKGIEGLDWALSQLIDGGVEFLFEVEKPLPLPQIKKVFSGLPFEKDIHIFPVGPAPSGEAMGYDGLYFIRDEKNQGELEDLWNIVCKVPGISSCIGRSFYSSSSFSLHPKRLLSYASGSSEVETLAQFIVPLHEIDLSEMGKFEYPVPLSLRVLFNGTILELPLQLGNHAFNRLGEFFDYQTIFQSYRRFRLNGKNYLPFFFKIKDTTVGDVDASVYKTLEKNNINKKSVVGMGGIDTMNESFGSMIFALSISAVIVFLILYIQFQSATQASIIMGTIPLALGGAIIGLILMGETLNASVMVGFILLVGIVVNNGIFLVEATNQKVKEGLSNQDAVSKAVDERTRPILMTSLSTIFGMLPTLLIGGEGSELYRGMAIVNVFGMIAGTFLSVVVTPMVIEFFLPVNIPMSKGDQSESVHGAV